jgi:hypothetical protein
VSRVSRSTKLKVSTNPVATAGVVSFRPVPTLRIIPALSAQQSDPATLAAVIMAPAADAIRGGAIPERLALAGISNVRDNLIECLGLIDPVLTRGRHLKIADHSQCRIVASGVWILMLVAEADDLSHQVTRAILLLVCRGCHEVISGVRT